MARAKARERKGQDMLRCTLGKDENPGTVKEKILKMQYGRRRFDWKKRKNKLKERKPFGWARECPEDLSVCQVEKILIKNVKKNLKNKLKKGLQCCNSRAVTKMCSQTIKTTMTRCDWCPTGVNKNLKKFLSYYESYRTYLNEPGAVLCSFLRAFP